MCGTASTLQRKGIIKSAQLKFYKALLVPVLNCSCENWAMNRWDKRKIKSVEMKLLIEVAGFTLEYFKRNAEIQYQLLVFNQNEGVEEQKKLYFIDTDSVVE
jgi:hypothetical protein